MTHVSALDKELTECLANGKEDKWVFTEPPYPTECLILILSTRIRREGGSPSALLALGEIQAAVFYTMIMF